MRKRADKTDIEAWRRDYWRLVKDSSNKEMAGKLGVDPGYLSRIARGAGDKNGKPKNPGAKFLKTFYMTYPPDNSADINDNTSKSNEKNGGYNFGDINPLEALREAQVLYMNRTNDLLDHYKSSDEFSKKNFTDILHIATTMAEAQKESVVNQGAMIEAHRDMTKGVNLLAQTNRDQYLELRGKKANPKDPTAEA